MFNKVLTYLLTLLKTVVGAYFVDVVLFADDVELCVDSVQ